MNEPRKSFPSLRLLFNHRVFKSVCVCALLVLLGASPFPQSNSQTNWRTATSFPKLNLNGLSAAQRTEAIRQLRVANCPCGCGMKIAECLIDDPTCPVSPGLAKKIVANVARQQPQKKQSSGWQTATSFPKLSFAGLTSAQRDVAIKELRAANCPCGCGMKIAECLIDDPTCPVSPGLARKIVEGVRTRVQDWRTATSFPNISFTGLTTNQRTAAIQRLRDASCPCGCGMKIAECLIDDPTCPESPGIARGIVASVVSGDGAPRRSNREGGSRMTAAPRARLHVITITDSYDEVIGRHCSADGGRISGMLRDNIAQGELEFEGMLDIEMYKHTPANVIARIRRLKVRPNDSVVFYFSGHGGYNRELGQVFKMHHSRNADLRRETVRKELLNLNARLTVLLSDCCYGFIQPGPGTAAAVPNFVTRPLMRSLFFEASGFVDITSSKQDQISYTYEDDNYGSIFTTALSGVASKQMNRPLGWNDFFRLVKVETERDFRTLYPGGFDGQVSQTPFAFALGAGSQ